MKHPQVFDKVTTLKCQVFVITGPERPFVTQVGPFAKELTDLWELLLKKEVGIVPFAEMSSK